MSEMTSTLVPGGLYCTEPTWGESSIHLQSATYFSSALSYVSKNYIYELRSS